MIAVSEVEIIRLIQNDIYDSKFRGGILTNGMGQCFALLVSDGRLQERFPKQRFWIDAYCFIFQRNHRFFDAFDEKFQQLWTGGLRY